MATPFSNSARIRITAGGFGYYPPVTTLRISIIALELDVAGDYGKRRPPKNPLVSIFARIFAKADSFGNRDGGLHTLFPNPPASPAFVWQSNTHAGHFPRRVLDGADLVKEAVADVVQKATKQ